MPKLNSFAPTKPHDKQKEVLKALDEGLRFTLLRAGRKWRKTSLSVSWLFEGALDNKNKNLTFPYIAPSKVQAKNIVWDDHVQRILDEFNAKGMPYKTNEVELSVDIKDGGKIQLFGVENAEALRGISNWGRVVMDEYDDWSRDIYPLIIRPNLITHKAPVLFTGTPKGKKNLWRMEQEPFVKSFHFTSMDNPDIDPTELEELIEEYKTMGSDYYRQEILAQYIKPAGVVYREWEEKSQFIKVDYEPNLPLHITFDWGVNDPTVVIWLQPHGNEVRVIDYYEKADANIQHFISYIRSRPYKNADLYTGDPAGKARTLTTGTSPIDILAEHDIFVRIKHGVKIPEQVRILHSYMPNLFVSNKLPRLRDCLLNYRYPEVSSTLRNQKNEIPIHDEFSHGMRALEYWAVNYFDLNPPKTIHKQIIQNTGAELLDYIEKERSMSRVGSFFK